MLFRWYGAFLILTALVCPGLSLRSHAQASGAMNYETGYFTKHRQNDLGDVTRIITADEIRMRGAINLKDVLLMETGGLFSYDKVKGWQFQWHGSSKGNILILIDGFPFRSQQFDEYDLSQVPLDLVDRIEITENPLGVAYGPSAIMAVVNILLKSSQQKVYKPSLRFRTYSPGSLFTNLNLGRRTSENFFRMSSSVDAFAGMAGNDSGRVLQWLPYTRLNNHLYYSHKVLQYLELSLGYNGMFEQKTQLGYPYPQTIRAYDREIRTLSNAFSGSLKGQLTASYKLQGDIQYLRFRRYNTLYLKDISTAEQRAVNDTSLNDTISYANLFSRWVLTKSDPDRTFDYQAGFELAMTTDRYKPRVNNVFQNSTTTALFLQTNWHPVRSVLVHSGIRLPYNSRFRAKPIWDIRVNYKFNPQLRIKGGISRCTKAPTFDQMFATYLTNGYSIRRNLNLSDESVMAYQYSLLYTNGKLRLEPGFFNYVFRGGIELDQDKNSPGRLIYRNTIQKKTIGTRISISRQDKYTGVDLRMILTGNNHFANLFDRQLYFQEVYSNITARLPDYGLSLCYVSKLTSRRGYMGMDEDQDLLTHFNSRFYLADMILEKTFGKKTFTINAGIRNLFNVRNINSFTLPIELTGNEEPVTFTTSLYTGRTFYMELHINL